MPVRGTFSRMALGRGLALTIVLALAGASLGFAVGTLRSESVVARATVLLAPLEGNPFSPGVSGEDLTNLLTEAELVSSDAVAQMSAEKLDAQIGPEKLRDGLSVTVPPNTQILEIEYRANDRATSIQGAEAFSESFLDYRRSRTEGRASERTERIETQIGQRTEEFEQLIIDLGETEDPSPERTLLQGQIESVSTQIGQLRTTLTELDTGSSDPGQIITPAAISPRGFLDTRILLTLGGLILGLTAALAVTVLRSGRKAVVHDVADIEAAGLPVLGELRLDDLVDGPDRGDPPGAALGKSFQDLRVALLTQFRKRPLSILLTNASVSSIGMSEFPLSSWGVAEATARGTLRTILLDASGALPGFELADRTGLTELLLGQANLDDTLVTVRDHLDVIPIGMAGKDIDDLLLSPAMLELVDEMKSRADVVVIVTGSARGPRARAVATMVDVVVVEVGEGGTTNMRDLTQMSEQRAGSPKFGGVIYVNGQRRRRPTRSGAHART